MDIALTQIAARIIDAQERYIALLGAELNELVMLAAVHGWRTSRKEQGEALRAEIKSAVDDLKALQKALEEGR